MAPRPAADPQPGGAGQPGPLSPADGLAQLSFLIQGLLEHRAREHDLSVISTRLLGILRDRRPTMNELARFLDLDKSSVTGLVDRAERRGLVERRSVPGDRRAVSVALTPAGRRTATEFHAEATAELEQILAPLAPAQRASFRTALVTITRTAGPADGCGPRTAC
jgi:DNA-binding MarR family transcriptional regulator